MTSNNLHRLVEHFERVYREQMRDVAVINPKIAIEAVGFTDWRDSQVGVLVTPWFMNLVFLPKRNNRLRMRVGQNIDVRFPDGVYSFMTQQHEQLGIYLSCSLFSPMFDFVDHAQAVATAQAVIEQLLRPPSSQTQMSSPQRTGQARNKSRSVATESKPLSRRALLGLGRVG